MERHRLRWLAVVVPPVLVLLAFVFGSASTRAVSDPGPQGDNPSSDCSVTSVGFTPLNDLGAGTYGGFTGGLYPGGANVVPATYLTEGMGYVGDIYPRLPSGEHSCNGKIVLLSIGMSNTTLEFSTFKAMADVDPLKNPRLTIVDGAQGGQDAEDIRVPTATFWITVDMRLADAGVTPEQVQVVWLKEAIAGEHRIFPNDAIGLQGALQDIVDIMRVRYPNLQVVYLASRIYAGYATSVLNPEPYAYQSGFAAKWLIEARIGTPGIRPWLAWGPYLWADGLVARSDGLQWVCSDFYPPDGTHPDTTGRQKVADMLLNFLKTDTTATPWFLDSECIPATPVPTNTPTPCPDCTLTPTITNTPTRTNTPTSTSTRTSTSTPTITRTPTRTPAPGALIIGHVFWQGHLGHVLPITLTVKSGLMEVNYPAVTTDASGFFTVTRGNVPPGNYLWRTKGPDGGLNTGTTPGYLARSGNIQLPNDPVANLEFGLQRTADINGDNVVDISDFNALKSTFGKSLGQGGYDGRADFDGNDTVDIADFNMLKLNFGTSGAMPI